LTTARRREEERERVHTLTPGTIMSAPARDVQMIRVAAPPDEDATNPVPDPLAGGPRDVASLFPNAAKKAKEDAALEAAARMREAIGANRFVGGGTVVIGEEEKEVGGGAAGTSEPYTSKSLAEQLAERKRQEEERKEQERNEHRLGGARPLDEDELEFLGRVRDAEEAAERRRLAEEASGVADFRREVEGLKRRRREEEEDKAEEGVAGVAGVVAETATVTAAALIAPQKPKSGGGLRSGLPLPLKVVVGGGKTKKKKEEAKEEAKEQPAPPAPTLGGLLGAYGSSSSEDGD
jgi:hypothetical protein